MPHYEYNCLDCGIMEVLHTMTEPDWKRCPECGREGLEKMISSGGAVIIAGREANQYSDILKAKYWRDKNGVRHKVQSGDGHSGSGTITKQTATPEEIAGRVKQSNKKRKQQRMQLQEDRARMSEKTTKRPKES